MGSWSGVRGRSVSGLATLCGVGVMSPVEWADRSGRGEYSSLLGRGERSAQGVRKRQEPVSQLLVQWTASGQDMGHGVPAHRHVEGAQGQGGEALPGDHEQEGDHAIQQRRKKLSFVRLKLVQKVRESY